MKKLTEAQQRFLAHPFLGVVTTLRQDGSPHSTVVWVDHDDGVPAFNTAHGRAKPRHIAHDARVALFVQDPEDAFRWLSLWGIARLVDEGADAHIDRLAKKYVGEERYPWHTPEERRVSVVIEPERVEARGIDEP